MQENDDITLLVDGREAFPEILRCIDAAERSIVINMFIWRADEIGKRMAEAVLRAADRGVKVGISVDRYAIVLERSEECTHSFFHEHPTLVEWWKIGGIKMSYPDLYMKHPPKATHRELQQKLLSHKNVTVERDRFKADHSKFYIIDEKILILGGINIEDKENGADVSGRIYRDYMVKLVGEAYVRAFRAELWEGKTIPSGVRFVVNTKPPLPRRFMMMEHYLSLIREAKRELQITMPYFSPLRPFLSEILAAYRRGVKVSILVPERANFENDSNRKTVRYLLDKSNGGIAVYLSPRMVHAKMMYNEKEISLGSSNITKKAFRQLSELNLAFPRDGSSAAQRLIESDEENRRISRRVRNPKEIRYRRFAAWLESLVV